MSNHSLIKILSHNLWFLTFFCSELPVKVTMGKGIGRIYKYDQRNWPYPYPNTTFFIPPSFGTSIQTQRNSDSYASVGAHYVSSSGLDKITNHHGNTDGKDNDDSHSYEKSGG